MGEAYAQSWLSPTLHVLYEALGWFAFVAWSCSFYPQVILNFKRKSVVGLNFDYLLLNLTKHTSYLLYNACMYFIPVVQRQYHEKYGFSELIPVGFSDVAYSIHAVLLTAITANQVLIYEKGTQKVSLITVGISGGAWFAATLCVVLAWPQGRWFWLVSDFNNIQVAITVIKYIPQVWMNYHRKSTAGYSIENILLDLCGGFANIVQMGVQSIDQGLINDPSVSTRPHIPVELIPSLRHYWAAKKREQRSTTKCIVRMREDGEVDGFERKKICRAMAKCWRNQTQGLSENVQVQILEQLLQHPTFSGLPQAPMKVERALFSNICKTLSEVKTARSNNELFLKRATVMACLNATPAAAADTKLLSTRNVAKALGVHRRNIIFANSRLQYEDDNGLLPLSACERQAHRTSSMTLDVKDLVFDFWATETRVSPNKKDICQKRIGRKALVMHPIHLLDLPQAL